MTIGQAGRQIAANGEMNQAAGTTAEQFVKNHFSKYVKIAKECGTNLEDCGFSEEITTLDDNKISMPTTLGTLTSGLNYYNSELEGLTSYAFILANGYAVNLFYNPTCTTVSGIYGNQLKAPGYVCINAVYDMNGKKKPNTVGKDIGFVSVIYPDTTSVAVAPNPYNEDVPNAFASDAQAKCTDQNENLIVPNKDELLAMYYNNSLLGIEDSAGNPYWSSSRDLGYPDGAFVQDFSSGYRSWDDLAYPVRCIWR